MIEFVINILNSNYILKPLSSLLVFVIIYITFLLIKRKLIVFRDILLLCGFFLLGFGLWRFIPWVSYSVCGVLLMCAGYFMSERK